MPKTGTFFWHELVTTDQSRCGDFYAKLFEWSRHPMDAGPLGTYTVFKRDGEGVAGMMNPTIDYTRSRPPAWFTYIAIEDVDACAEHATRLGGTIIVPPEDIPGVGRVCMLADPSGAPVRVMKPLAKPSTGPASTARAR